MTASCWKHNGTADVYRYALRGYQTISCDIEGFGSLVVTMKHHESGNIIYVLFS